MPYSYPPSGLSAPTKGAPQPDHAQVALEFVALVSNTFKPPLPCYVLNHQKYVLSSKYFLHPTFKLLELFIDDPILE